MLVMMMMMMVTLMVRMTVTVCLSPTAHTGEPLVMSYQLLVHLSQKPSV